MNLRLVLAGICLLLASSGLFAASSAPYGIPLLLTVAAGLGATVAVVRFGVDRTAA